ncbi:hypothetical protein Rxycam_00444 [Rubrobacter xylanophilus DSM 9941]|uniref:SRPBCC family protein n=1 Tax=Rubrobacter xylanophilus TaxID=49319 RepID=UPI001C63B936|nr:SRPBCC family protein [Rubrobacter xylanophilus]QYJ14642.1 hypothetical protein Rxycam_00444 [Rubrobacter xylanophilus DSM 9941]
MPQRVEGSIEIEAPVERVYGYWENLENLPSFMSNVEEVRSTGPDTTRWRVKGPFGRTLEWEARTTQRERNRAIAWNSVEGQVETSGQVRFIEVTPNRTRVEVRMNYWDPPGGRAGEVFSRVVSDPKRQLEQDLRNLKDMLEGRVSAEEARRRPAAATVQSGTVAGLGAVLVLLGAALVLFLVLRGDDKKPKEERRFRIILEFF